MPGRHLSIIAPCIRVGVAFLTDQEMRELDADATRQAQEQNEIDTRELVCRRFVSILIKHTGMRAAIS